MRLTRRHKLLGGVVAAILLLSSCSDKKEDPTTERDEGLSDILDDGYQVYTHKSAPANTKPQDVKADEVYGLPEGITLTTTYSTDYNADNWRITDSKTLDVVVEAQIPRGRIIDIYVESMHADVTLMSKTAGTDGMTQDSMDTSTHSGSQLGGYITGHPFTEAFVIEGSNDSFVSGYMNIWDGYGYGSLEEHRPVECELRGDGDEEGKIYGNRFHVVFNFMVSEDGGPAYQLTLDDEFKVTVPYMNCDDEKE